MGRNVAQQSPKGLDIWSLRHFEEPMSDAYGIARLNKVITSVCIWDTPVIVIHFECLFTNVSIIYH